MAKSGEEVIDSKIKDELDALNSASGGINKLENEVQRARATFKLQKDECRAALMACMKRVGKNNIMRSKNYYELLNHLLKIQAEVQKATQKFQMANSVYKAALETVSLAEEQLVGEDGGRVVFDGAWQEMLNHANLRFSEAEKEKRLCEAEHQSWSREFDGLKAKLSSMHRSNAKSISKSKMFYEMKRRFESKLQAERQNAEDLQLALLCNKQKYRMALNNLERISEELHVQRQLRTPGVGAESDTCSELSDSLTFNFDFLSDTSSQVSSGDLADFDSDLTFMSDWEQEESLFSKVSTRFNRSTSLSNLGDRNKFPLTTIPASPLTIPESLPSSTPSLSLPNNSPHVVVTLNNSTSRLNTIPSALPKSSLPPSQTNVSIATSQQISNSADQQQQIYTTLQNSTFTSTTPNLQQQPILKSTKTQLKANKSITTTITHNHPLNPNTQLYKHNNTFIRSFIPYTNQLQQKNILTNISKSILSQKANPPASTSKLSLPLSNLPLQTISTSSFAPLQTREITLEGEEGARSTEPHLQQHPQSQLPQAQHPQTQRPQTQHSQTQQSQTQYLQSQHQQSQLPQTQLPQQQNPQHQQSKQHHSLPIASFTSSAFLNISSSHDNEKGVSLIRSNVCKSNMN